MKGSKQTEKRKQATFSKMAMQHKRQAPGRDIHRHFSLAPARSHTIWAVIARDELELPTEAVLPQVGGACRDPVS